VGLGGGSVLDMAKGVAILATHSQSIRDYQMGDAVFVRPGLPVVAVPTTAGTGSEVSRVVVVDNKEAGIKRSVIDHRLIPKVALLDPELTLTLPTDLTCTIGLDAFSHALESFVSLQANPFTEAVGLQAMRLIGQALPRAVRCGTDVEARGDMLFASSLAGLSLSAGVGAAHILAQPISAVTGLSHSQVITILLPYVVRANSNYALEKYATVAGILNKAVEGVPPGHPAASLDAMLQRLQALGGIPARFRACGVTGQQLADAVEIALRWQMHIRTNPRPVDRALLQGIVQAAY
jgi:alcohol dehydrogenase